jgi:hypothetical protein
MAKLRSLFALCIALCCLILVPSVAQAGEAQCGHRLIHDWYVDGQIQGQYRVSCYQAALADVPSGDMIYATVRKDLSQALSSGISRVEQKGVTVGPETLLAAPQPILATPVARSQNSHPVLFLVALGLLLLLLLVWFAARWRSSESRSRPRR